jgi:hypothetical protein
MTNEFPVSHRPARFAVRFTVGASAAILVVLLAVPAGAVSLVPLATFGGGDGWLAPGENGYGFLGTGNLERGLAYGNGHLYLVSRNGGSNVRILDPATGVDGSGNDLGSLNITGISGGTFAVDMVAVGGDGVIYVGNLQVSTNPGGGAFYKVYSWANESSTPTVAYSGDSGITGVRVGDDLALVGSGSSTRLAAGYSGNSGYSIIDPTAGTATAISFSGSPPASSDFRLGITFTDSNHVLGGPGSVYRYSSFSGASGTLLASPTLTHPGGSTAERLMAYTVLGSHSYLAMQSTGDSHVSIYDATDLTNPIYLIDGDNVVQTGLSSNGNATGEVAWGASTLNGDGSYSQILYAMSTNQGIQAFTFTTTPPGLPGDFNSDGKVDAGDYVTWNKNNGTSNALANDNGLGVPIGPAHYDLWRANFGNPPGSGSGASLSSSAVPEPCTMLIALFVAGSCLPFVRKR